MAAGLLRSTLASREFARNACPSDPATASSRECCPHTPSGLGRHAPQRNQPYKREGVKTGSSICNS
eukprot:2448310-Amphidinium_carterae.1